MSGASGHVPTRPGPLMPEKGAPHQEILSPRCQGYLPLEEYTVGEALKDAGYRTGFVGKWHLGHDEKYWPEHQGFDVNVGGGRWPGPPSYFSPYRISKLPDGFHLSYVGGFTKPKVNDKIIKQSVILKDEDIIAIGSVKLQFVNGNSAKGN